MFYLDWNVLSNDNEKNETLSADNNTENINFFDSHWLISFFLI